MFHYYSNTTSPKKYDNWILHPVTSTSKKSPIPTCHSRNGTFPIRGPPAAVRIGRADVHDGKFPSPPSHSFCSSAFLLPQLPFRRRFLLLFEWKNHRFVLFLMFSWEVSCCKKKKKKGFGVSPYEKDEAKSRVHSPGSPRQQQEFGAEQSSCLRCVASFNFIFIIFCIINQNVERR